MRSIVIVGAGGFGRETLDVIDAINTVEPTWTVLGVVDDAPSRDSLTRLSARDIPHLGGLSSLPPRVDVALAVGSPSARAQIGSKLSGGEHQYPTLVHPSAVIGSEFRHGSGCIVLGSVSVGTNVRLGDHVHINAHAVIGHDTRCYDFVSVNPNATVSGECSIRSRALVGAAATVLQGLSIGEDVTVGAGACVVRTVPDQHTVRGVPAR